jgi:hypothetical protein
MRQLMLGLLALVAITGCNLLKVGDVPPDTVVKRQLNELQIAVEKFIPEKGKAKIAVLGVVDTAALKKPAAGEEVDQTALDAAAKRERDVRQGLNAVLVENTLMEVVQPAQEQQDKVRAAIAAANSCTLDAKLGLETGQAVAAEYLVDVLIDDTGKQVNVAVQRASDGVVVYQNTLKDWQVATGVAAAAPEAAAK